MPADHAQIAVIYSRVSSVKQVTKGDGLASQETRCREFASHRRYEITEVFRDEGVSGGMIKRPGMQAMLSYIRKHRALRPVVLIDDISRLARGLEAHIKLRTEIGAAGGRLESPSVEFGEDSDSQLVEHLLASVSQHHRQKNAEQAKNRMRARMLNGYWVFPAPIGYRFERMAGHGKLLVRNEPMASVITEVLEGFAAGRFESRAEIKRYLEQHNAIPNSATDQVSWQKVTDILNRALYAGYIEHPDWDVSLRKGHHEALISFETYQAIKKRLREGAQAPIRKDISEDFPLRGFVTCADCERPMTASWAKGRSAHYPYYLCATKGCASYGKSIKRAEVEEAFEALLGELRPSAELFAMAREMFRDLWDQRLAASKDHSASIKQELAATERKIEQLVDRLVEASSTAAVSAYEKRLQALEESRVGLTERIANCGRPLQSFDEAFRTAFEFLGNPQKLWVSERIEDKRMVCRMVFAGKLPYARNEGFRTAPIAQPFRVLEGLKGCRKEMVGAAGIEPATPAV